ncbi:hypothetical protein [Arenicella xantha]|uniref:hypothetical protein n=1 Tax=Arenicella xantha TaxID=644221 RepID=UPI001B86F02E|nr:hypothetical protein [Arenicella xantha]
MKIRVKLLSVFLVWGLSLFSPSGFAHAAADAKGYMPAILSLLINDETISVTPTASLNVLDANVYTVDEPYSKVFPESNESAVFCFAYSLNQSNDPSAFVLTLNGVEQDAFLLKGEGEYCIQLDASLLVGSNSVVLENQSETSGTITNVDLVTQQFDLQLPRLNRLDWDVRAVRKVLKLFAFGGQAFDSQIVAWANMLPEVAIQEMLNFDEHNSKLSPLIPGERYPEAATQFASLVEFADNYMGLESFPNLPMDYSVRNHFRLLGQNLEESFYIMSTIRGLNPFRQRIGFWETNYHLALSLDATVSTTQMAHYYDVIMEAHESGASYEQVLALAAKTSAVAVQYGHENSVFFNGICFCNDDFAREIHQLYFGIFGVSDPSYHENVTIKNTSKMLTDMSVGPANPRFVNFGTNSHHVPTLTIFNPSDVYDTQVSGASASEKIDNLMMRSIEHVESLKNLPVMIVEGLADDTLNEDKKISLRAAWQSMGSNKNFLEFIRAYATSSLLHDELQSRSLTSFERAFYKANRFNIDNIEALYSYRNGGSVGRPLDDIITDDELVDVFRPEHNVFGGQTPKEAADSVAIFANNYNRATDQSLQFRNAAYCNDCDAGDSWAKDWRKVIPSVNGTYPAGHVARWLWEHTIGDLDDYTDLEEAHLLPLLAATRYYSISDDVGHNDRFYDLAYLLCMREDRIANNQSVATINDILSDLNYCSHQGGYSTQEKEWLNRQFTTSEISNDPTIQALLDQLHQTELPLGSEEGQVSRYANERINHALSFIFATPFVFGDENISSEASQ